MPDADVVIAWAHGGIPASVHSAFARPTKFVTLPSPGNWKQTLEPFGSVNPVRGMVAKYAPGTSPLRVALLGFSASCQGVAQVLASGDGGRIDAALAIDGIHVGYTNPSKPGGQLKTEGLRTWLEFGKQAIVNERLLVVTHSAVVPSRYDEATKKWVYYASTTETANYLWDTLTGGSPAFAVPPLPPLEVEPVSLTTHVNGPTRTVQYPSPPWSEQKRAGGLVVLGCSNLDKYAGTTDHQYQARRILPLALAALLAARWNDMDPRAPEQACYVG